ncbi:TonB-dependent receptor [Roseovarius sp.]|jgi:hemoglobin/transferrin/lactoferrin receptor protein|uniref:TonB-dependent receptor domain-containing protein n=1 Tax=Roseovarius sp. TaxID=1486281 RepID=UPI00261D706C|nr:TonB-dependent receptor [Roseovarius sp.]MDM8165726.1 TonB-dependent receptor [Roseovarius sp.]
MRRVTPNAAFVVLIGTGGAFAQAPEPFVLGTIYIGSDATSEIGIDNEDLTRTTPKDLQEVFKSEPSVSVGSSLPISQKIYVNGVEENNLNVTIDGARQNNRIFHHSATTYIDPELLKAVRVDPGVAPADAGPGAMAGAIAFETKDVNDLLEEGRTFGGRFITEYQSNGNVFTNSLAIFGVTGGFEYLAFGKYADGGLREDGDGVDITGSGTQLTSGLAKVAYNGANGSRLELSYENVRDDAQRPLRADFAGLRGMFATRTYTLERQNLVLSYEFGNTTDMWNPTVQIAYNSTDLYTGPMPGSTDAYSGETTSFTGKFVNEFTVSNGTVKAGADFYSDVADINGEGTAVFFAREKANNFGLFVQAELDVTDRFRLSTGARYDFQEFEGLDGTTYDNDGLSANISGDYDVSDAVTLSAGASHVWGGIALAESFLFDPAWTYPASIEPVTSENYYLGANVRLGNWDLNARLFKTNIDNARTLLDPATGLFGASPGLVADLDTEGFEVSADYNWSTGFARIAYANIDNKINGGPADSYIGRYLTTPLGDNLVLEVANTWDPLGLTLGADAQLVFDESAAGAPGGKLGGFEVFNLFAEYTPRRMKNLTIRAEIDNLFDETYTERATYGQEFATVTPLKEPGRSFNLRASLRF